jgi:hypothetical protein
VSFGPLVTRCLPLPYGLQRDEGALEHLEDIRLLPVAGGRAGVRVEFHFGKTKFFKQKVLWKEMRLSENHSPLLGLQEDDLEGESPSPLLATRHLL